MAEASPKPTILIVYNHYQLPGGEDFVAENEKRLLKEHGHRVFLYTRTNKLSPFRKALLPLPMFFNLRTWFDIRKLLRENHIDIVHVHNIAHVISPSVFYAAKSMDVPVVQTIHNYRMICPGGTLYRNGKICESCKAGNFKPALKHRCYRGSRLQTLAVVLSMKLHRAAGIYRSLHYIALSEFGKEQLLRFDQIRPQQVYIEPNFTFSMPVQNGAPEKAETYYLFAGRLDEMKGIRLVTEAFKKMPEKKLKIAGNGPLMDEIRSRIHAEKLENIELLGWLSKEKLKSMMDSAAALIVCPQWYETFCLTIIEAFSEHLPVIGGRISNVQNLIKDKVNGLLFQYDSVQGLIDAVNEFERCDRKKMADSSYQTWLRDYSPDVNYQKLEEIYEAIGNRQ